MPAATDAGLIEFVKPIIVRHEGYEPRCYRDTLGIPTIGVGLNMTTPQARALLSQCGADYQALLAGTAALTPEQCDYLCTQSIITAIEAAVRAFANFASLSLNRQAALTDMAFNLGYPRLSRFHQMIAAVHAANWQAAVHEMLDSEWAEQVGERAREDAAMLLEG